MFENYKARDASTHGFNFGEEDMDRFQSNRQEKLEDRSSKKSMQSEVESGPIDYIAEAADTPPIDMTNLNLFGDPESTETDSRKEMTKKRQVMRELIDAMERLDPSNELQDFEKPKTFIKFSPLSAFDQAPDEFAADA